MTVFARYEAFKTALALSTGYSKDALHVFVSLAVVLLAAPLFGRRLAGGGPLLLLLIPELLNEAVDFWAYWQAGKDLRIEWLPDTLRDLGSTFILPVLLTVIARYRPRWLTRGP